MRKERLELSRRKTLEPKSSASTNFATSALPAQKPPEGASVKARDGVTEPHYFQRIGALPGISQLGITGRGSIWVQRSELEIT